MNPARVQRLQEIESLSKDLLQACEQEEWDSLTDIENRRGRLVRQFFDTAPTADESEQIAAAIHRIQSIDRQVISLCQTHKQELGKKLSGMAKGKSVQATYQQY